jgi:hypothetical protein
MPIRLLPGFKEPDDLDENGLDQISRTDLEM